MIGRNKIAKAGLIHDLLSRYIWRSKEHYPYQSTAIKSQWLGGWRAAIEYR